MAVPSAKPMPVPRAMNTPMRGVLRIRRYSTALGYSTLPLFAKRYEMFDNVQITKKFIQSITE